MERLGFYFDMERCIACKTCQVACKDKNNLDAGTFFRKVITFENEENGQIRHRNYSGACNHCKEAGCVAACPVGAMHYFDDGTVGHDKGKCIGCGACVWNCPYGEPQLSKKKGISQKCDSCIDVRKKGKNPACVDACLTHCLEFGKLDELRKKHGPGLVRQISILPDESITDPSVLIKKAFTEETFIILGGGIAGVSAASAIRERKPGSAIIIIDEGSGLPYNRTAITKTPELSTETAIRPPEWYAENRIELLLSQKIRSIDTAKKEVLLADGKAMRYDKCVYALGAESFVPPIQGSGKEGVIAIRRREDTELIRKMALKAKNAAVIGGGVIGIEVAWELKKAGVSVTIIEVMNTLMERLLDKETAEMLEAALVKEGIGVVTGARISEIGGDTRAENVTLSGGEVYPADFIIMSCGIRSNSLLAKDAGVNVGRAVVVNKYMETSEPDLYACGDCSEYEGVNAGLWTCGEAQGLAAGANAAGDRVEYIAEPAPLQLRSAGINLFSIGDLGKKPDLEYDVKTARRSAVSPRYLVNSREDSGEAYEKYYYCGDVLVGAALIGDLSNAKAVSDAVKGGKTWENN